MADQNEDGQSTTDGETEIVSEKAPKRNKSGMALTGLILGIVSIILALIPIIGLIIGVLGIVFGSLGLRSSRRKSAGWGLGLGIAGVILSFIIFVVEIASMLTAVTSNLHG